MLAKCYAGFAPGRSRRLASPSSRRWSASRFFSLLLDQKGALAAIPKIVGNDASIAGEIVKTIRSVVSAVDKPEGVRAERLAEIERLLLGESPRS